ncbi:MAG: HlyD family efflux transporter periplasmic adaptor subunit [Pseudomonadota bacterium]
MKKRTWIIIIVLVVAVVVGGVYSEMTASIPVQVAPVRVGEIRSYVEDRAKTWLPKVYRLSMPLDGRIEPIHVRPGDRVQKGEVVAKMDTADLDTQVAVAESRLGEIRAQITVSQDNALEYTTLKETDRWIKALGETVKAAEEVVKASEAQLAYSEWWYGASKKLAAEDYAPEKQLRESKEGYVSAKVSVAKNEFMVNATKAIQTAVELGPRFVRESINRKALQRDVLKEQFEGASALLARAKRDRERALIRSPIDGVVLKRHLQNEWVLPAGAPLLDIGHGNELEIEADILSQDAVLMHPGDEVAIYGAAIGETPIKGKVTRIRPEAFTKVSSLGVEQQRVSVIISFEKEDLNKFKSEGRTIGVGYRVRVRIFTAHRENAMIVPRQAVFLGGKETWQVFTVQDNKARMVPIKVGLTNDHEVEIVEGVNKGDTVIVAPPKSLVSGVRVKF